MIEISNQSKQTTTLNGLKLILTSKKKKVYKQKNEQTTTYNEKHQKMEVGLFSFWASNGKSNL